MKKSLSIILAISLTACANTGSNYQPVIDSKGVSTQQYQTDLYECQQHARQVSSAGERAAVGAVLGVGLGLLFAALLKDNSYRGSYAAVGGLAGAGGGAQAGEQEQRNIIKTCLHNRGYSVLN